MEVGYENKNAQHHIYINIKPPKKELHIISAEEMLVYLHSLIKESECM